MESNKKICKVCHIIKDKILVGKFNGKDKKYHDGIGKTWNGAVCPSCHKEEVRRRMQAMRVLKKSIV